MVALIEGGISLSCTILNTARNQRTLLDGTSLACTYLSTARGQKTLFDGGVSVKVEEATPIPIARIRRHK
jgi:hypothetical protein